MPLIWCYASNIDVYIGGDSFQNFRYFVPVLPLLMAVAFVYIERLRLSRAMAMAASMLCLSQVN